MVQIFPDRWNCVCVKNRIDQVIHNLVLNARQASLSRDIISVRAESAEANGSSVAISVADQGTGIARQSLNLGLTRSSPQNQLAPA
jgi:signal transduction histidine kinase